MSRRKGIRTKRLFHKCQATDGNDVAKRYVSQRHRAHRDYIALIEVIGETSRSEASAGTGMYEDAWFEKIDLSIFLDMHPHLISPIMTA
jgi:hypothetical protein